jgi:dTDP-glucose 4,6-dehydratase
MILVTGGAGFIGSNFVLEWIANEGSPIVNLDKLTYAGNLDNLAALKHDARHIFVRGDINDRKLIAELLGRHRPDAIVHFAAESHVDRSIYGPGAFIETNTVGTFNLLEVVRNHWMALNENEKLCFRFVHVSTDEVYGSLETDAPPFRETSSYAPNSPYAASKAAADHWVRAYHHTYGLPTVITNCSNNYGPYQFPEKLIPLVSINALQKQPLPVYGDGANVRDWLHVSDHCAAVRLALKKGTPGAAYNIGGDTEKTNLEVVKTICRIVDELEPNVAHSKLITFVKDRPGHDRRYAIDATKIRNELGWKPSHDFENGLRQTVQWYAKHRDWIDSVTSGAYRDWIDLNYAKPV